MGFVAKFFFICFSQVIFNGEYEFHVWNYPIFEFVTIVPWFKIDNGVKRKIFLFFLPQFNQVPIKMSSLTNWSGFLSHFSRFSPNLLTLDQIHLKSLWSFRNINLMWILISFPLSDPQQGKKSFNMSISIWLKTLIWLLAKFSEKRYSF